MTALGCVCAAIVVACLLVDVLDRRRCAALARATIPASATRMAVALEDLLAETRAERRKLDPTDVAVYMGERDAIRSRVLDLCTLTGVAPSRSSTKDLADVAVVVSMLLERQRPPVADGRGPS